MQVRHPFHPPVKMERSPAFFIKIFRGSVYTTSSKERAVVQGVTERGIEF